MRSCDRLSHLGLATTLCLLLVACGPSGSGGKGGDDGGGTDGGASADGGGASDGGGGDGGGASDGGGWQCAPDPTLVRGDPVTAPDDTWTWIDVPETRCMDGSSTGFGIRLRSGSDKVVIYLQGGGACFDRLTCSTVANQNGFGEAKFQASIDGRLARGIFDVTDPANPLADWNMVFVPYCSGDVHAGSSESGAQGRVQVGLQNFRAILGRLVPTFEDASQVLLTGSSAGGFGAALNFPQTQEAFGCVRVDLLDDSGPPLSDTYLKPCLQQQWRSLWDLDAALPVPCEGCSNADGGGIVNFLPAIAARYPQSRFGLLSTTADQTIRTFFSYGYAPLCDRVSNMPAADFEAGLLEVRDEIMGGEPRFATFYVQGDQHTFLGRHLENVTVGGTDLATWIGALVGGDPAWTDVGP